MMVDNAPDPLSNAEECVICLSPISDRAIVCPCNHCSFDFICVVSWVNEQPNCPLCKSIVTKIEYDWREDNDHQTYHVKLAADPPSSSTSSTLLQRGDLRRNHANSTRNRRQRNRHSPPSDVDVALIRRRNVYRHHRYSLHVGSNRYSGFVNFTTATFSESPSMQARAKVFLRRELQVFSSLRQTGAASPSRTWASARRNNAQYLINYLVDLLKTADIKGGQVEDELSGYLDRQDARLLIHELSSWLRSPFQTLEEWDRFVQYPQRPHVSVNPDDVLLDK